MGKVVIGFMRSAQYACRWEWTGATNNRRKTAAINWPRSIERFRMSFAKYTLSNQNKTNQSNNQANLQTRVCKTRLSLICVPVVFESALDSEGLRKNFGIKNGTRSTKQFFAEDERHECKSKPLRDWLLWLLERKSLKNLQLYNNVVQHSSRTWISRGSEYVYKISTRAYEAMCEALYALL